jgi:hypothetical protein
MCSQPMVNARQTPIAASPSTNIAGNHTNKFIGPSSTLRAAMPKSGAAAAIRRRKTSAEDASPLRRKRCGAGGAPQSTARSKNLSTMEG